jgi:hypothetical protein
MGYRKSFLLAIAASLIISLFYPWVVIESKNIVVSGMQSAGTTYGKPGLLSLFFAGLVALFSLVPRIWAHRICIFSSAINCGWALRNFLILSVCQGGECPQRKAAFYIYLLSSILLLVGVLILEVKMKATESPDDKGTVELH